MEFAADECKGPGKADIGVLPTELRIRLGRIGLWEEKGEVCGHHTWFV